MATNWVEDAVGCCSFGSSARGASPKTKVEEEGLEGRSASLRGTCMPQFGQKHCDCFLFLEIVQLHNCLDHLRGLWSVSLRPSACFAGSVHGDCIPRCIDLPVLLPQQIATVNRMKASSGDDIEREINQLITKWDAVLQASLAEKHRGRSYNDQLPAVRHQPENQRFLCLILAVGSRSNATQLASRRGDVRSTGEVMSASPSAACRQSGAAV